MREMLKYGFILGLICFLASGVLSVVNAVTEPKIKLQKEREENLALKEVMPDAANFKAKKGAEKTVYYIAYDKAGQISGFVVKGEGKGYSSLIEALAGLNLKLEITKVKILFQNETPGLGSRIIRDSFLAQFKGKGADSFNQAQAIAGATISSSAAIKALKNKITEVKEQLLEELKGGR